MNKKLIKQNTQAINFFIENGGPDTRIFLFEMLAIFTKTDPGYTDEYRTRCVMHFELLNDLITSIKPV